MHIDTCIQQYGKIQVAFRYVFFINVTIEFLASIFGPQTNTSKQNPKCHFLCFFKILINACK
jgi:hypothetical protein